MLARTADNLFWLSRYVERAECLARILDATFRLSSLPQTYGAAGNEWESALETAGCVESFEAVHDHAQERNVVEFICFSPDNPSSIRNCLEIARANARSVRTALTMEMWDVINGAWNDLQTFDSRHMDRDALMRFLAFVKETSVRIDGSAHRTMLRNDGYCFSRLGVLIERADATARILDVKYHLLLPREEHVGGPLDYFQWASILRSVSALTSYHWVYRDRVKPWLVADLLILNAQMPRSLACCYQDISRQLESLARFYGRESPAQPLARGLSAKLGRAKITRIFQTGLHEFIEEFLEENNKVGLAVMDEYLS